MAYNASQFNQTHFNVQHKDQRYLRCVGTEIVTSAIGTNLQVFASGAGNERVTANILGARGRFTVGTGSEKVTEQATRGIMMAWIMPVGVENVQKDIVTNSINRPTASGSEEVTISDLVLGQYINLYPELSEEVNAEAWIAQVTKPDAEGFELVSEATNIEAIDTRICYIGSASEPFTLKPGQRLVVDAKTYNILLNGNNAIWTQSGEWIDEMTPETVRIMITAAAGSANLTATILYTEQYL